MMTTEAAQRFWKRVDKEAPLGCWQWTAGQTASGYGSFRFENRARVAHRVAYEEMVGPIEEGRQLDHLCRNRLCVNPEHLEAVTQKTNLLRGISGPAINARKTRCVRGHEFTPQNTYRTPRNGYRECRTCKTARKAAWDASRRTGRAA